MTTVGKVNHYFVQTLILCLHFELDIWLTSWDCICQLDIAGLCDYGTQRPDISYIVTQITWIREQPLNTDRLGWEKYLSLMWRVDAFIFRPWRWDFLSDVFLQLPNMWTSWSRYVLDGEWFLFCITDTIFLNIPLGGLPPILNGHSSIRPHDG